jgi:molybdate transport system ATP-binding protein
VTTTGEPGLHARIRLRREAFELDAELSVPVRGVTGLFGASASGKTTLLRCIAGLERPREGRLAFGHDAWLDGDRGICLPAHRRPVGYVFQDADLFPHLDVRRNLEYGHRRRGRAEGRLGWDDVVGWLGVAPLLDRMPAGLSGGERQRVAIARALLAGPRLLLMDEPLSAVDEPARREILRVLDDLRGRLSIPIVYVSHSLREVARLADRLVWLDRGRVRAAGPVGEVLGRMDFARWQGADAGVVVDAVVREHDVAFHLTRLESPWGDLWVRRQHAAPGQRVRLEVLAGDVGLGLSMVRDSSVQNEFALTVRDVHEAGPGETLVRLEPEGSRTAPLLARITTRSAHRLAMEPGRRVYARVKAVAVLD